LLQQRLWSLKQDWFNQLNEILLKAKGKSFLNYFNYFNATSIKAQAGLFVWASIPSIYKDGYELVMLF